MRNKGFAPIIVLITFALVLGGYFAYKAGFFGRLGFCPKGTYAARTKLDPTRRCVADGLIID